MRASMPDVCTTRENQQSMTRFAAVRSPSGFNEPDIYQSLGKCISVMLIMTAVT